ncbi:MAG: hypothetical protein JSR33_13005 [Proteobacteria bacterium]|nr:hypothetical protein [Pseudomonadota bacterium]
MVQIPEDIKVPIPSSTPKKRNLNLQLIVNVESDLYDEDDIPFFKEPYLIRVFNIRKGKLKILLVILIEGSLYICAGFAIIRNAARGYQFIERLLSTRPNCPRPLSITLACLMGAVASISPFHQISNSIKTVLGYFKENTRSALVKFLMGYIAVGIWSGGGFAEMGGDSLNKTLSVSWGIQDSDGLKRFKNFIWTMTFISQSMTFTVKILNLKLRKILAEAKENPITIPSFLLNIAISAFGVYTNYSFGEQAVESYIPFNELAIFLGILSAAGPWGMNVESFRNMAISIKHFFNSCLRKSVTIVNSSTPLTQVIIEDQSAIKKEAGFSFKFLDWKMIFLCFLFAFCSLIPSIEFSLQANADKNGFWLYFLVFCNIVCNFFPKFTNSIENRYKEITAEEKKINQGTISPEIKINGSTHPNGIYTDHSNQTSSAPPPRSAICLVM